MVYLVTPVVKLYKNQQREHHCQYLRNFTDNRLRQKEFITV